MSMPANILSARTIKLKGTSLFLFGPKNRFRNFLSKIVVHKTFEMLIFAVIILSAMLMGIEDPLKDPEWQFAKAIRITNNWVTCIFVAELVMKVIVYGLLFN